MSRDVDPCNCDQAREYDYLLRECALYMYRALRVLMELGPDDKIVSQLQCTISDVRRALSKYEEATEEYEEE